MEYLVVEMNKTHNDKKQMKFEKVHSTVWHVSVVTLKARMQKAELKSSFAEIILVLLSLPFFFFF